MPTNEGSQEMAGDKGAEAKDSAPLPAGGSDGVSAEKKPPRKRRRLWKWLALSSLTAALLGAAGTAGIFWHYGRDLPGFERLTDYAPPQVTKVYDRSGVQVAEFFTERRTVVGLEEIPKVMLQAMVSAEDGNFYQHSGLDYIGILRAFLVDLKEMRLAQGASTITQQVIKNMVLSPERSLARKVKEAILARRIEQNLTKDEILTLYLNHIYFGHGRYGIYEASTFYFGKEPHALTLGEAAMLAGLPQSPGRLSPLRNPKLAKRRQRYVLEQMARNGFVSREEAEREKARPIHAVGQEVRQTGKFYVESVRRSLLTRYDRKQLYEGGMRITLAMDAGQQAVAEAAVAKGLENLEKKRGLKASLRVLDMERAEALRTPFAELVAEAERKAQELKSADVLPEGILDDEGEAEGRGAKEGAAAASEASGLNDGEVQEPAKGWDFGRLDAASLAALAPVSTKEEPPEQNGQDGEVRPPPPAPGAIAAKLKRCELVPGATLTAPLKSMDERALVFDLGLAQGRVDRQLLKWAGFKKKGAQLPAGGLYRVRVLEAHPKQPKKASKLTQEELDMVPLDLVPVPSVQAALVAIDPSTRLVTAIVGGYDFADSQFNRATQARRQPGSSFKPIVYGAALESGRFTLASILNDAPDIFRDRWTGKAWRPQNFERNVYEGPMGLREALSKSKNTISVRLIEAVEPEAVIDFARRAGIASPLPANLTLGLGTGEVTPLELANAYATLASGGKSAEPAMLLSVRSRDGNVLEQSGTVAEEVISPGVAFLVTSLMESVIEEGTGRRARALRRPVAGKTGTASENRDAWFSGFTPDLVATVWVGRDDHKTIGRSGTGGAAALPIWVDFMKGALENVPPSDFVQPPEIIAVRIDPKSGRRIVLPEDVENGLPDYFIDRMNPDPEQDDSESDDAESASEDGDGAGNKGSSAKKVTAPAKPEEKPLPGRIEFFVAGTEPEEIAAPEDKADPRFFLMEAP